MTHLIEVKLKVFIPSEAVTYSVLGYGGTFNGGTKCEPAPTIDLDVGGSGSLDFPTPSWGMTRSYDNDDAEKVSGKPDWYRKLQAGAEVIEEMRLTRPEDNLNAVFVTPAGASHGVAFTVVGTNPLLSLAPAIDAEVTVALRRRKGRGQCPGEARRFPLLRPHGQRQDHVHARLCRRRGVARRAEAADGLQFQLGLAGGLMAA